MTDDETEARGFADEDWEKLTSVVEIEEEDAVADTPHTIKLLFAFRLQSGSLSLLDGQNVSFMHGNISDTHMAYTLFPKTQSFSFEVSQSVLSCPDGVLMTTVHQSGNSPSAVTFEYTLLPQDTTVAARLKLRTSSTYVTFRPEPFVALKRFLTPAEKVDVSVLEAQAVAHIRKVIDHTWSGIVSHSVDGVGARSGRAADSGIQ